jgi:hypothetical protein
MRNPEANRVLPPGTPLTGSGRIADSLGSMEDGAGAVGVDADLDPRLDEMAPWDLPGLQAELAVRHPVVDADLSYCMAKFLVAIDAWESV